jgi:hypothetical protein
MSLLVIFDSSSTAKQVCYASDCYRGQQPLKRREVPQAVINQSQTRVVPARDQISNYMMPFAFNLSTM